MPQKRMPTIVRYLSKVDQSAGSDGCWPWTGAKDPDGYGIFWDGTYRPNGTGHCVRVTRWTYQQFIGEIPSGHHLLHSCDNPPCVNPSHLWTGTEKDNHQDRETKGRGGQPKGSKHYASKLTDDQVRAIRVRYAAGGVSMKALGAEFGVTAPRVHAVVHRLSRGDIE
jgi:hypothetical protein